MAKSKIIYEDSPTVYAKFNHPQSQNYIEYKSIIQIKDSGKQPITIQLEFTGIPEWHLLKLLRVAVLKDFFACLRPRFHQSWVGFWSFFHCSWFDPAGTVTHSLFGDQHQ